MIDRNHPFQPPCPFTPFHCQHYTLLSESNNIKSLPSNVQNHCLQFSHVCRFGRRCHQTLDVHWKTTIHVARKLCHEEERCLKKNQEDHLSSFTHPNMHDIRRVCRYRDNDCRDRHDSKHIMQYRHNRSLNRSGAIRSWGLNDKVDFVQNQITMYKTVADYVKDHFKQTLSIPPEIPAWIRGLQPVHRCSNVIFESILVHGHVMSRDHMERLTRPRSVADSVLQHKRIRSILDRTRNPDIERIAKEYIQANVSLVYSQADMSELDGTGSWLPTEAKRAKSNEEYEEVISSNANQLHNLLKRTDVDDLRHCSTEMAKASLVLMKNLTGIGYPVDKSMGTDKHIFCILGPHHGFYYGDIVIIFKTELMRHPDANFSIQAGTSVHSGSTFKYRHWVKDSGTEDGRIQQFHESKLHCSIPGYDNAAAAEIMAIAGVKDNTINVNLKKVLEYWNHVDSHKIFEGHLPSLVPLDYIEDIYMPKNVFESLSEDAKKSAKKIFGNSLTITDHIVDLANGRQNEGERKKYNKDIVEILINKFNKNAKRSPQLHGTFITVPPSDFGDHIRLPLTISKAYEQYQAEYKTRPPTDDVYIYWQSMDGDVMITLSDQLIGRCTSERPQCLVCYVAKTPSTTTSDYHESYSYLNSGQPYQHFIVKHDSNFAKGSNTFHRGCNVDDFLTYCLRIEMHNGQVTLSHAGSNRVYNRQTISHTFHKRDLNLTKLNYIYVSTGSLKVPIRNFTICFSKVLHLHPSVDDSFKRENLTTMKKDRSKSSTRSQYEPTAEPAVASEATTKPESPSMFDRAVNWIGSKFKGKKLEACPDSINCLHQNASDHTEKFSHPCRFSELCTKKDDEPYLTHFSHNVPECRSKNSCSKLDDPVHRGKYRHEGKPDFLIPCNEQKKCKNKSYEHRIKYSHGEHIEVAFTAQSEKSDDHDRRQEQTEKIACRYGLNCHDKNDADHCVQYSHPDEHRASSSNNAGQHRIACRHGTACRDKNDADHCAQYSHLDEHRASSSNNVGQHRIACRHGTACRDKNDPTHCADYSHPDEQKHGTVDHSRKIQCKHGTACQDINDAVHCSKYSHPNE
ncbi:unnamed protein product [Adineta steineri]|uniref:Uncharacterized protein n=1 Tax=Adineta steineri TaxID=433720 RepID=A0A815Q5R1_9BILA|nr:unnamed protein product [Adineta steineri]